MQKQELYFDGVSVSKDSMTGVISSDQLVEKFGTSWIPPYQRGRVLSKKKIASLTTIFKNYGSRKIDSIKINLNGDCEIDKKTGEALLVGQFSVIDGQQRLYALKESKVTNIKIPVELYINLSEEDQVRLFHQFNKDGTQLTFGELAKSAVGPFADSLRTLIRRKTTTAIPVAINGSRTAIGLNLFCPVIHHCHRRLFRDLKLTYHRSGKALLKFLETECPEQEVDLSIFAAKNVLAASANVFGTYDSKALVYSRSFFSAWSMVIINNFMTRTGKIEFDKFTSKINSLNDLSRNAHIREVVTNGGANNVQVLYNAIIDHLNYKLKGGHLPRANEIEQSLEASTHLVGAHRKAAQESYTSSLRSDS